MIRGSVSGVVLGIAAGLGGSVPFFPGATLALDFAAGRYKGPSGQVVTDLGALGPELVVNGDFASSLTGWTDASTAPSTVTWSGGAALFSTDNVASARLRQSITTVVGRTYQVSSTGTVPIFVGASAGASDILGVAANATRTFVAVGTTTWLNSSTSSNGFTLDNVSVREVLTGFQFTRTGAGQAEDTSGVYASFATNVPRRTNKGLLVEEQRANSALGSADVSAAGAWTLNGGMTSVAETVAVNPFPHGTPRRLTRTSASGGHVARSLAGLTGVRTLTVEAIVAAGGTGNRYGLRIQGTYPARADAVFDLAAGTVVGTSVGGSYAGQSATIAPLLGGFYLLRLTATTDSTGAATLVQGPTDSSLAVGTWEGASSVLSSAVALYAGIEEGSFPTSPILTTGAAATRGADNGTSSVSALPADFTVCWEGVLNARPVTGTNAILFEYHDGTANNRFHVRVEADGTINAQVTNGGSSTLVGTTAAGAVVAGASFKIALRRLGGSWRLFVNGVAIGSETAVALPVVGLLEHGRSRAAASYLNGWERSLVQYPHANPIAGFTA